MTIIFFVTLSLSHPVTSLFASTTWTETQKSDWSDGLTTNTTWYSETELNLYREDWFNSDWKYRRKITINNTGSALLNYQVFISTGVGSNQINLDASGGIRQSGKCKNSLEDFRCLSATGTVLSFWIGPDTTTPKGFWVQISSLPAGTTNFWLYYGNTAASRNNDFVLGSQSHPAESANQIYRKMQNAPSGNYYLDPDSNATDIKEVYCEMGLADSGWTMVLRYDHTGGTNPGVAPGSVFPKNVSGELKHVDNIDQYGFSQINAVRLYGKTSGHTRIIHYYTTTANVINALYTQNVDECGAADLKANVTTFGNHTANLPASGDTQSDSNSNQIFGYGFPMYLAGTYHWALSGSGTRWEVDDYPGDSSCTTLHEIYIRCTTSESLPSPEPTIGSVGAEQGKYYSAGNYKANVLNSGEDGTKVHQVDWNPSSQPAGTSVQVSVRASNSYFASGDGTPSWTSVSNGGDPALVGRYIQWMSTFTTTSSTTTPRIEDITLTYTSPPAAPSVNYNAGDSYTQVTWKWADNSSGQYQEDGFKVYSSTGGILKTLSADTTCWTEAGLKRNTKYGRYVQSHNTAGSNNSVTVNKKTQPCVWQEKATTRTGPNAFGFEGDGVWTWKVPANGGSLLTITAYAQYNSDYGSADKPKITLSNYGINSSAQMTGGADIWEKLTVSGTPSGKGVLFLKVEGFSTAVDAKYFVDDIQVNQP